MLFVFLLHKESGRINYGVVVAVLRSLRRWLLICAIPAAASVFSG
ncbi:MAG: hypothetical protein HQ516_06295 [Chlorobium sp.]|nr:hypothetical protein [Chlorobium sp.]